MQVTVIQLATLVAVAELGSMIAAARQLGFSASTVTAHVQALERHAGSALVARTADGTRLTCVGRRYEAVARRIVSLHGDLADVAAGARRPGSGEPVLIRSRTRP